jgi:hypothetical protein
MYKITFAIFLLLTIIFSFSGFLFSNVKSSAFVNNFQKSINIRSRYSTDFGSNEFKQVVDRMKSDGANTISMVIQNNVQNLNSNDVFAVGITPTDDALVSGVNYIKSKGMNVAFNMFIDCNCGNWRAEIDPGDRNQFFASYSNYIQKYSKIAQTNGISYINLGTELAKLTGPQYGWQNTQKWRDLISTTRSNYSGKLTYGGNWGAPYEELSKIEFWNDLDYIGISAYFDLSKDEIPSVATLQNAWANVNNYALQPLINRWNKPIMFTEIGYRSVNQAGNSPGDWSRPAYFMEDGQANAFEAMFSYFDDKSFLAGVNIWDVNSDPNYGGQGNVDYTFVNKKAEPVVKKWFLSNTPVVPIIPIGKLGVNGKMAAEIKSSTTNLKPNQQMPLQVNIQNRGGSINNTNVLLEVVDSSGAIVYKDYFAGESFTSGETKLYSKSWTPTKSGSYILRGGVFASNWASANEWFENISNINIEALLVSSSTVSSTPVVSSSLVSSSIKSSSSSAISSSPVSSSSVISSSKPSSVVSSSSSTSSVSSIPVVTSNLSIWWPANDINMTGVSPLKAVINGKSIYDYKMYWQVDNGSLVEMYNTNDDGGYKFFWVDFGPWTWKPKTEKYKITFVAKDNTNNTIAINSVNIFANR